MEGGLMNELCEDIRVVLFDIVGEILKTENFKIQIEAGSKQGDHFIGTHYRIKINTADNAHDSSLFLKVAPTDQLKRSLLHVHECFLREMYAYEVVLPYFQEFQESKGIERGGFTEYAKFFKSIKTEPIESVFTQDLVQRHFTSIDINNVTPEHIVYVMMTLGKFHAISFALKDQQPEKFTEIVSKLNEIFFVRGDSSIFAAEINNAETIAMTCITEDADAHYLKALLKLYETNQYDLIADLVDGNASEPYSVILHGDMWSNNTMFKYDESGNKLRNIRFIDWQVMRYGSPVLDLVYYIFTCTSRELRGRYYNIYLKAYHDSLSNLLRRLGSDPDQLFPYSAFEEQLQKFGKFGLLNVTFLLPLHLKELEEDDSKWGRELTSAYKNRFRDIVADMVRLGYI